MSLSLHLQSIVASALTNIDGSHSRPASHHERGEGFTEVFGNKSVEKSSNYDDFFATSEIWRLDDYYVFRTRNSTIHQAINKTPDIRINQYRPSYSIQLLLRLTSTPHLVFNSPHACSESNGPLPTVIDLQHKAAVGSQLSGNRISGCLNYLLLRRQNRLENCDFQKTGGIIDLIELTSGQKAERTSLLSQCHELSLIQKGLKYGDRPSENLYIKQSMKAHLYPNGDPDEMATIGLRPSNRKLGLGIFTWFHIWTESIVARKEVASDPLGKLLLSEFPGSISEKGVNLAKAVTLSRHAYETINWKLSLSTKGNLLDTEDLTLVDIVLFEHLAEALCNVHLVAILADFEYLVVFFQTIYEKFFGKQYLRTQGQSNSHWIKWNNNVNALNQFNRIPVNDIEKKIRDNFEDKSFQDAFKIMQSVALHCRDLKELVVDAAELRREEGEIYGEDSVPKSIKGKWLQILRMGGEINTNRSFAANSVNKENNNDDDITKKSDELLKKALKEARRNDDLWISATICATLLSLALSLSVREE